MVETTAQRLTQRAALESLSRTRLQDLHARFEVRLPDESTPSAMVESLLNSRRFPSTTPAVLSVLDIAELRQLCRDRGLEGTGNVSERLIEALLVDPQEARHELEREKRRAFQRLPGRVQEEIRTRQAEIAEQDDEGRLTRWRSRKMVCATVMFASLVTALPLHFAFWQKLILVVAAGGAAWASMQLGLERTRASVVQFTQAAALTLIFGFPQTDMGGAFLIVFFFCYWALQVVMGTLVGMTEEGCFRLDD